MMNTNVKKKPKSKDPKPVSIYYTDENTMMPQRKRQMTMMR